MFEDDFVLDTESYGLKLYKWHRLSKKKSYLHLKEETEVTFGDEVSWNQLRFVMKP